MKPRIYNTDDPKDIAEKIWKFFEVHDLCIVTGFDKGMAVLKHLEKLDRDENVRGHGRVNRKLDNSIGGAVAHKIFRYNIEKTKYTIWRLQ